MGASDRLWRRLLASAAWDGLLPVFVVSASVAAKLYRPDDYFLFVLTAIVVPIFAAKWRASAAHHQLIRICDGRVSVLRQLGVAVAIILLLLCEIITGALTQFGDEPESAWLIPVTLYSAYLMTIAVSLHPSKISPHPQINN